MANTCRFIILLCFVSVLHHCKVNIWGFGLEKTSCFKTSRSALRNHDGYFYLCFNFFVAKQKSLN